MKHAIALIALLAATSANAWTLDGDASTISYVSIKNADTAEPNLLPGLSGGIDEDGSARIEIALDSVETYVDIRNERMKEHLFQVASHPIAALEADLDLSALDGLENGASQVTEFEVTVLANDTDAAYPVKATVTRIADDRVLVASQQAVIMYADDLGYDAGINKLREIAGLDSIQLVVPVDFTLFFDR